MDWWRPECAGAKVGPDLEAPVTVIIGIFILLVTATSACCASGWPLRRQAQA